MRYRTQRGTDGVTYALVPADRIRHLAHRIELGNDSYPVPADVLRRQAVEAMGREIAAKLFEHAKVRTFPSGRWTTIHAYGFEVIVPEGPPAPEPVRTSGLTVEQVWDYLIRQPGRFTVTDLGDIIEVRRRQT